MLIDRDVELNWRNCGVAIRIVLIADPNCGANLNCVIVVGNSNHVAPRLVRCVDCFAVIGEMNYEFVVPQ